MLKKICFKTIGVWLSKHFLWKYKAIKLTLQWEEKKTTNKKNTEKSLIPLIFNQVFSKVRFACHMDLMLNKNN